MSDLFGWLIEADNTYWDGTSVEDPGAFVSDANKAVRFLRFEDAEKVKHWLLAEWAFALRTTQHGFLDAAGAEKPAEVQNHAT